MKYSKEQIIAHRIHCIDFLKQPHLKKFVYGLENINNSNERCCLGHMCVAMNIEREVKDNNILYGKNNVVAPNELVVILGLTNSIGEIKKNKVPTFLVYKNETKHSLSTLNDDTLITTQEIGELLETMIEGGDRTPFLPLSEYE